MIISEELKSEIRKHALQNVEEECCGVIYETTGDFDLQIFPCRNSAENKKSFFSVNPEDYLKASLKGKIKAIYHSHITENEEFSLGDKENSQKHKLDYILYNTKKDSFYFYKYKTNGVSEISKEFIWGVSDCLMLVKEHLNKEDIPFELPENHRKARYNKSWNSKWFEKFPNAIRDTLFLNNKLKKITGEKEYKKNDIFCFSIFKSNFAPKYDHFAVYIGENQIYHHPINRYPSVEDFGKFYKSKLVDVYRYLES
tara:strand:- start:3917 stop:4681 length:765 start_codon:yes stop_codon:yes gene_type:complete